MVTVNDSECCIEGNMTSDDGLLMACSTIVSEENDMFVWDGAVCTRSFDEVVSYQIPSNGGTITREQSTTPKTDTVT